jgi:multiple sugar transport system substrate-binding protein
MSRREFLKVASVSAAAAALAACAPAPADTTQGEGAGGAPSAEAVTIEFWTFNDYAVGKALDIFNRFIKEFEEKNPGIKVNLTGKPGTDILAGLVAGAGSGDLPDSVQIQLGVGGDLIAASALADMAPYWDTMTEDYKKQFNPGAMTPCIQDGKVYGLPFSAYAAILFRNLKVLQKAGIDPQAGVKDWEDFASQLEKVSQTGAKGLGKILGNDWCQLHYYGGVKGTSKQRIAQDGKSTDLKAEAYAALFEYALRIKPYCIGSFMYDTATHDLFMTDQLAFVSMGPWLAPTLEEAKAKSGLEWDAIEIPGQAEDWKGTVRGGEFTGIMPTDNKEAAWKWASFISDYPQEAIWAAEIGRLMANDKALQQPEVQKNWLVQLTGKAFNSAVDEALFMRKVATGFSQPEIDYGNLVDTGSMKPAEAAQAMVDEINKILAGG